MKRLIERIKAYLRKDPVFSRVLKNTGYLFSSNSISLMLSLVQSIFAARLLGVGSFGLVGIITALVSNVNRLFSFRMGEFIVRFLGKELTSENQVKAGAVVKVSLLTEGFTSLIAFAVMQLLAPLGAQYIAKDMTMLPLIRLFSFAILANVVNETSVGVLQITNHFRSQAAINLGQSILTAIIIFLAFLFHGNILTVVWAYLLGKVILGLGPVVLAFHYLRKHIGSAWWKAPFSVLPPFKEMASYAVSTNLSGTIKMVVSESEPLWVGFFLDKNAVGLYKLALSIVNPLMMPITPFISTVFPEMTRSIIAKKWAQLRQLLRRVTGVSAIWTVSVFLLMAVLGKWLIGLFYTNDFIPAFPATMILLLGFGFSNIFFWNRSLFLSFGKANIPLYVLLAAAILKVGLSFVIVPRFGIAGEAWLLSGNFILSVGVLVLLGLGLIRKHEREIIQAESA